MLTSQICQRIIPCPSYRPRHQGGSQHSLQSQHPTNESATSQWSCEISCSNVRTKKWFRLILTDQCQLHIWVTDWNDANDSLPSVLNITRPAGTRATKNSMLPLPWPILTPDTHPHQKGFFSQLHLGGNMMPSLLPTLMNHPCVMAIHSRPFCPKPSPRYHVAFASPQTMAIVVGAGQTKQAEQKNRNVQRPLLWMLHWIRKLVESCGIMRHEYPIPAFKGFVQ